MIPLGVKNSDLKHVMSFRRQTAIILNAEFQHLDVSAKLTLAGKDTIFISTESMKCFSCGVYGHTKLKCTNNKVTEQNETEPKTPSEQVAPAMKNGNQDSSDKTDQRAKSDSLSKDDENPKEDAVLRMRESVHWTLMNALMFAVRRAVDLRPSLRETANQSPMEPDELVGLASICWPVTGWCGSAIGGRWGSVRRYKFRQWGIWCCGLFHWCLDAPTSFFFGLEKKPREQKSFHQLEIPGGGVITDQREIQSYALSFYEDLYCSELCDDTATDELLCDLSKLTEEERNELDGPLILERFHKLFRRCVLGSHPDWMGFLQNFSNPFGIYWSRT